MTIIAWDGYDLAADSGVWCGGTLIHHTNKVHEVCGGFRTIWAGGSGNLATIEDVCRQLQERAYWHEGDEIPHKKFQVGSDEEAEIFVAERVRDTYKAYVIESSGLTVSHPINEPWCSCTEWGVALMQVAGFTAKQTVDAAFGKLRIVAGSTTIVNVRPRPEQMVRQYGMDAARNGSFLDARSLPALRGLGS